VQTVTTAADGEPESVSHSSDVTLSENFLSYLSHGYPVPEATVLRTSTNTAAEIDATDLEEIWRGLGFFQHDADGPGPEQRRSCEHILPGISQLQCSIASM
jgi:hypothetical protein